MKGLLLENYYKNKNQVFIMNIFLICIGLAIIGFLNIQSIVFIYFGSVFFSNSLILLLSQRKDYDLKLYKSEKLLPINGRYIILSKYISQICLIGISLLISAVLIFISWALGKNHFDYGFTDAISLLVLILAFVFNMTSFFYLGLYILDYEKGDLWIILGMIVSVVFLVLEISILNIFDVSKNLGNMLLLIISSSILLISYFFCTKYFEKSH